MSRRRREKNEVRAEAEEDGPHPAREVNLASVRSQIEREVETEKQTNNSMKLTYIVFAGHWSLLTSSYFTLNYNILLPW